MFQTPNRVTQESESFTRYVYNTVELFLSSSQYPRSLELEVGNFGLSKIDKY